MTDAVSGRRSEAGAGGRGRFCFGSYPPPEVSHPPSTGPGPWVPQGSLEAAGIAPCQGDVEPQETGPLIPLTFLFKTFYLEIIVDSHAVVRNDTGRALIHVPRLPPVLTASVAMAQYPSQESAFSTVR